MPHQSPGTAAAERYAQILGAALGDTCAQRVVVATMHPGPWRHDTRSVDDGSVVYRLPPPSRAGIVTSWAALSSRLRAIIATERIGLVNAHGLLPGLPDLADVAAHATKGLVPLVLTYHAGGGRAGRSRADLAATAHRVGLLPRTAGRAVAIICSSPGVQAALTMRFGPRTVLVPPAVRTDLYGPGPRPDPDRIVFSGPSRRGDTRPDLEDLLSALAQLRADNGRLRLDVIWDVSVIGDSVDRRYWETRCRTLGVGHAVRFYAPTSASERAALYHGAAVVVVATSAAGHPAALLEAMACGRAVICRDGADVRYLLASPEAGLVYAPGDVDGLTDRIRGLLDDRGRAERLGAAGRARVVSERSASGQAQRTMEVYRRALGRDEVVSKRVAVVTPFFPPHVGGVERYAERIARGVGDAPGLEAVVITTNLEGRRDRVRIEGGLPIIGLGCRWRISNTPIGLLWPFKLRRVLTRQQIDLIDAHAPVPYMADVAARVAGTIPFVLTYHSGSLEKGQAGIDVVLRLYERIVLRRTFGLADAVVTVSPVAARFPARRSEQIPPGVDTTLFHPDPLVRAATDATPVVLYVGRMERASAWKGVDVLLDAFASVARDVPGARLRLVGGGDATPDFEARARRDDLMGRVDFAGWLGAGDLARSYQTATVVVLPSRTESESFGMTLLEAMACGRPVIASAVGGIPSLVTDGHDGMLVPPGDAGRLADAIVAVLSDPTWAQSLGDNGVATAQAYQWPEPVRRTIDLLREIVHATGDLYP